MMQPAEPEIRTVTELTHALKSLVEARFPTAWVQGEISGCTHAGSGHIYLTLKDDLSQLRVVIWRSTAARLRFDLHDGLEVVVQGPLEIYQSRGTYQLIARQVMPCGLGALELAFRQLQEKLAAEGLFDEARKRPLPRVPRRIALITSPSGAAVRDVLQVITRRWRAVDIVILPVAVQGNCAAAEIAAAFKQVPRLNVDLVITGRGGGSLEDLWAFNEEIVARAISACSVPVISAVGHEIDVTIADLVADCRALTPTEAGELAVPDHREIAKTFENLRIRLAAALHRGAAGARLQLEAIASRPVFARPVHRVHELTARLDDLHGSLVRAARRRLEHNRRECAHLSERLDALSPLKVLGRGYSITLHSGTAIYSADEVATGDQIETVLAGGRIVSRVEDIDASVKHHSDSPAAAFASRQVDAGIAPDPGHLERHMNGEEKERSRRESTGDGERRSRF